MGRHLHDGLMPGGEVASSNGNGYALLNALNDFRDDVREDLAGLRTEARGDITALEGRLMAAISDNRRALVEYAGAHDTVHVSFTREREATVAEMRASHDRYDSFIESMKLGQAHRDGTLGAVRYVVTLLSANAAALAKIVLAAAVAALFASGGVHFNLGV